LGRQLSLNLTLAGTGWMDATVSADWTGVTMYVSYLTDAPKDLGWETVALLGGAEVVRCSWLDEPGEWRWVLTRSGEALHVVIRRFADWSPQVDDERGSVFFEAECGVTRFATQVRGQLQRLLNEHGEEGYLREWQHTFPVREMDRLGELIAERKRAGV
jgi:hypothetical protein